MLHGYKEPHSVTRAILDTHRKTVGAVKRDSFRLPPPPGKVLEALDRERLANHTLVYFTSDNGGRLEAQDRSGQLGGWNGRYRGDACGWAWSPRSARVGVVSAQRWGGTRLALCLRVQSLPSSLTIGSQHLCNVQSPTLRNLIASKRFTLWSLPLFVDPMDGSPPRLLCP